MPDLSLVVASLLKLDVNCICGFIDYASVSQGGVNGYIVKPEEILYSDEEEIFP